MGEYYQDRHRYDDILDMPHHQSTERPHMSLYDRAAQFAPFKAVTGHEEAIEETARLTEEEITLDETAIEKIQEELAYLAAHPEARISVAITYFQPDSRKEGGSYLTDIGIIRKVDPPEQQVVMESGMKIRMEKIVSIVRESGLHP